MAKKSFEKDLETLLAKTVEGVESLLKSEALAKADPGEESPAEETPPSDPPADAGPEAPPADAALANDADPSAEASPSAAPEASPEPGQDPATEDQPMSPEELTGEYMKLPIEELKMHMAACKAALMQMAGASDPGSPAPGAPPMGAPAPEAAPAPAPQAPEPEMTMKSEKKELEDLRKSVKELQNQIKAQEEGFKSEIGQLAKALEKPLRKSITSLSQVPGYVPPAAELSDAEVRQKLTALSRTPDLKKSDREAINTFFTQRAPLTTVAHLLK